MFFRKGFTLLVIIRQSVYIYLFSESWVEVKALPLNVHHRVGRFYYTDLHWGKKVTVARIFCPRSLPHLSPPFTRPRTKRSEHAPPYTCSPAPRLYTPAATPAAHLLADSVGRSTSNSAVP